MEKNEKTRKIVLWSLFGVLVVITIIGFIFAKEIYGWSEVIDEGMGPEIVWHGFFRELQINSDNEAVRYICVELVPHLMKTIQIITIAIALAIGIHYAARLTFRSRKGMTISRLMVNFVKWVIAIATVFFILDAWGAPATAMLASAGVVTLIIGLGSQSLVADILAGVFIVFEGDFQVGDIIIVDGWRGEVQAIGIRTTKLIDAGGNVKIVNNSQIKSIINQTKELSIAKCYVAIGYEARIENVEAVIADNIDKLKEKIPGIVEGPYIPFNQVVVHMGEEDKPKEIVTKKTEKKVQEFTEEQKELSKDIEIKK